MKIFFIVGENSGDALGGPLIAALKEQYGNNIECMGVGGPIMQENGFDELLPMDQISIMGVLEVIPQLPRLLKIRKALIEEIEAQQPDAVVTIDFPDFNFLISKSLKKRGHYKGKIIHYVAPSVWAWRPGRAKRISEFLDGIMCLFPMETKYFDGFDVKAEHVGHPLIASPAKEANGDDFREINDIPLDSKTVGLFFGSRESEYKKLAPIIKQAALLVQDIEEDVRFIVPTLPDLEYEIKNLLKDFPFSVYVTCTPSTKWESFKACNTAIAVSGTVALELSYAGVPHVIAYKVNPITALILKLLIKVKYAHLANILLERSIVPEFIQGKCTAENIAQQTLDYLQQPELAQEQTKELQAIDGLLKNGEGVRPSQKAAKFIFEMIENN